MTRPLRFPRRLVSAAIVLALSSGCASLVGARPMATARAGTTTLHVIGVGEDKRSFVLHVAPRLATPAPLFIVLHGTSANADVVMDESGMNAVADSVGGIVAYPNGTGGVPYVRLFWNVAGCCDTGSRPDEGAMAAAIVDTLTMHFPVDRSRVGVAGFSDAGTLAYLIACHEAKVVTAIGVVSGELPTAACAPSPPVSAVVFHGTADTNLRYGATREHVAAWARGEGCTADRSDTAGVLIHDVHAECNGGAVVELYTIVGGKHAWPGGRGSWVLAPRPSRALNASHAFAAFVLSHPRPGSC